MDILQELPIDLLLDSQIGQKIHQAMDVISEIQRHVFAFTADEDSAQQKLLRIGSVFQFFLMDTLIARKSPKNMSDEDWREIAEKVSEYAILQDGQKYSEFVFNTYADYIDQSADYLSAVISAKSFDAIKSISAEIRENSELLHEGELQETAYIEKCLWLSLEGMIKLLSSSLTVLIGDEYSQFAQAISQLAFEYGRYTLYAKEQAILNEYIKNQYLLDELIRNQYEDYITELNKQSEQFRTLIREAFSGNIQDLLHNSVALAREAGVDEAELLKSVDDIDRFFLE